MSTLKQQYKLRKFGFGNAKEGRFLRVENHEESRKNQRAKTFNANRNISISVPNSPKNKSLYRNSCYLQNLSSLFMI